MTNGTDQMANLHLSRHDYALLIAMPLAALLLVAFGTMLSESVFEARSELIVGRVRVNPGEAVISIETPAAVVELMNTDTFIKSFIQKTSETKPIPEDNKALVLRTFKAKLASSNLIEVSVQSLSEDDASQLLQTALTLVSESHNTAEQTFVDLWKSDLTQVQSQIETAEKKAAGGSDSGWALALTHLRRERRDLQNQLNPISLIPTTNSGITIRHASKSFRLVKNSMLALVLGILAALVAIAVRRKQSA